MDHRTLSWESETIILNVYRSVETDRDGWKVMKQKLYIFQVLGDSHSEYPRWFPSKSRFYRYCNSVICSDKYNAPFSLDS